MTHTHITQMTHTYWADKII